MKEGALGAGEAWDCHPHLGGHPRLRSRDGWREWRVKVKGGAGRPVPHRTTLLWGVGGGVVLPLPASLHAAPPPTLGKGSPYILGHPECGQGEGPREKRAEDPVCVYFGGWEAGRGASHLSAAPLLSE